MSALRIQAHSRRLLYQLFFLLFVLITTIISSCALIFYIRASKRHNTPKFPQRNQRPRLPRNILKQPKTIYRKNPIQEKSELILAAYYNQDHAEFSKLLVNVEPAALYDYEYPNFKSHIFDKMVNSSQTETMLETFLAAHPININKYCLLHKATRIRYKPNSFLETLIKHGADINYICETGQTPLAAAILNQSPESVRFLLNHGAKINIELPIADSHLHLAIIDFPNYGSKDIIRKLLANGANAFHRSKDGYSAFHKAILVLSNSVEAFFSHIPHNFTQSQYIKLLLSYPVSPSAVEKPSDETLYGYTPLHLAVHSKNISMVEFLVRKGADKSLVDNNGLTALENALSMHHGQMINILQSQ